MFARPVQIALAAALRLWPLAVLLVGAAPALALARPLVASPGLPTVDGGAPVTFTLLISDESARLTVKAHDEALRTALGYPGSFTGLQDPGQRSAAFAFLSEQFRTGSPLAAATASAPARLERLEWRDNPSATHGWVEFDVDLPLSAPARSVELTWHAWTGIEFEGQTYVPVLVRFGTGVDLYSLTPQEPQFIWHTREPLAPQRVSTADRGGERSLPLVSLLLALLAAGLLLLRKRLPLSSNALAGILAGLATGAFLLRGHFPLELGTAAELALPSETQALELFDTLQRNVYAAFDAPSEAETYDLLGTSVDRHLLDALYGDVHESLLLRDKGGAVCRVERVEALNTRALLPAPDEPQDRFTVDHEWRVHGLVSHWGHEHRRSDRYRATYQVRHDGSAWKLWTMAVHDRERLADGDP